ncbi:hypothetical protein RND81_09G230100 [Saponaria officinalis]
MVSQRFFYERDYQRVSTIAEYCVVNPLNQFNGPWFVSEEEQITTISDVVRQLDDLLLFSLPVGKFGEKVVIRGHTLMYFSFENLCEMTDNFCKENLFAKIYLGEAYRGRIQQDWKGMESQNVIVKIWGRGKYSKHNLEVWKSSVEDDICRLRDEVFLLTHGRIINHPNTVKLLGYCFDDKNVGAVYCHQPLDTLQNLLGDDKLSWRERVTIALDLGRFLELLHGLEPQRVVRNICAVHIMIDQDKKPFLYDFSMLKGEFHPGKKAANNRKLHGFASYRDPYYLMSGSMILPQSDVYAFGVLLMSLICKRDTGVKLQKVIYKFIEADYNSKSSVAHESFVNQPSFDQYDGDKLSALAMQCLRLDYPMSRPTASDIVKQLSNLFLFTGTRISADVDADVDVDVDVEAIGRPSRTKYTRIFEKLLSCASGKKKEEKQREAMRPLINQLQVIKTATLTPKHFGCMDIEEVDKKMKRRETDELKLAC